MDAHEAVMPANTERVLQTLVAWQLSDDEWGRVGELLALLDTAVEHHDVTAARQAVIGLVRWSTPRVKREISPTLTDPVPGPVPEAVREVRDKLLRRIGTDTDARRGDSGGRTSRPPDQGEGAHASA